MEKRYQVFISSTYVDLKEERRAVTQTVIQMDCIPAGMELFPAADEEQFEFIKKVINDCDYYLVIVGGRYGSTATDGISYTEKEYDYAVSRGLKVIALIHDDPDAIPLGKSEKDPAARERLEQFREKVVKGRLVKKWKSAEELPGLVALSLAATIKMFPAVGWVRANRAASEDLLSEINDLRKANAELQAMVAELAGASRVAIPDLAGVDDQVTLGGKYFSKYYKAYENWSVTATWREIFGYIAPYMDGHPNDTVVQSVLTEALFRRAEVRSGINPKIDDQEFRTVALQLKTLGLVNINYSRATNGVMALFWSLTAEGQRLMLEVRTVRKATASTEN